MRVDLSDRARDDIDAAIDWDLEKQAFSAASKFADEIDQALKLLAQYPGFGITALSVTRMRSLQEL